MVSNDPIEVRNFFDCHGGAVVKSLSNGYSVYKIQKLKFYSRYFPGATDELLSGLAISPLIFQKMISKKRELRVTVVDGYCFGMVADVHDLGEQNLDIRKLNYRAEKDRFNGMIVPEKIVLDSKKLMADFGLKYAGLDWIEDQDGQWYFLELNCMGAFKWSEICGAGDITKAIASALISGGILNE